MREYRFQADQDSIEAFRTLRAPWSSLKWNIDGVHIELENGHSVRIEVDRHDIEPGFAATCIVADSIDPGQYAPDLDDAESIDISFMESDNNEVVLFTGATWLSASTLGGNGEVAQGLEAVVQQSGSPADIPESAEAVCISNDALLAASPSGLGCLIRLASVAGRMEVITDRAVIAAFLTLRSWPGSEESGQQ